MPSYSDCFITITDGKAYFFCAEVLKRICAKTYLGERNSLFKPYKFCQDNRWGNSNLSHLIETNTAKIMKNIKLDSLNRTT